MDNYVFISYAHKDKKVVRNSIDALSSCGVNCWYDNGIEAGADWAVQIGTNLENAKAVVLFLSKHSVKSKNVRREISFAAEHRIPIYTIQLYKFKLPAELEKLLTVNQFITLNSFKSYKEFANSFSKVLSELNVTGDPMPGCTDRKIRISNHRPLKIALLASAFIAAALIIVSKTCMVDVPVVIGLATNPAEIRVTESGFRCVVTNGYSDYEEFGYIIDQNKNGSGLKKSLMVITQSLGPQSDLIVVPDVVGHHLSEGVSMLVDAGMKTFILEPVVTDEYEIAYIAGQNISPNFKVSSKNRIKLQVSTDESSVIEIYGQKIILTERKVEVQILEDNSVIITPLMIFGMAADYEMQNSLNESGSIGIETHMNVDLKREDTNIYGKYRGEFALEAVLSGDDSAAWKLASKSFGDKDGNIVISVKSDALGVNAEEYDEIKFKAFVEDITGSSECKLSFKDPIMMILGKEISITEMNKVAKNMEWIYTLASKFMVTLPKIEESRLLQPYAIVAQANGDVYMVFFGYHGPNDYMMIKADISYE